MTSWASTREHRTARIASCDASSRRLPDALAAEPWDAVIAARVLHHVDPLDDGVALLARLAPLLLVDPARPRPDPSVMRRSE